MDTVLDALTSVPKKLSGKRDDDFLDRLSSHYTTLMLIVFAILVTVQTYVGDAITCWAPVHVTSRSLFHSMIPTILPVSH